MTDPKKRARPGLNVERLWIVRTALVIASDPSGACMVYAERPSNPEAIEYMRVMSREEVEKLALSEDGVDSQQFLNSLRRTIEGQRREIVRLKEKLTAPKETPMSTASCINREGCPDALICLKAGVCKQLRSRQGESPSGTTSKSGLQQPRKPDESPALLSSNQQFRTVPQFVADFGGVIGKMRVAMVRGVLLTLEEADLYVDDARRLRDWLNSVLPDETSDEWRCFHCDEVFTDREKAAEHFGKHEMLQPACTIDVTEYRRMEEVNSRHCAEDTELHREIYKMSADHATALRREEERGYARGLEDAKKYPETIGLARAAVKATCGWGGAYGRCVREPGHEGLHDIPPPPKTGAPE